VQTGTAQGRACEHVVRADSGLALARPLHEHRQWLVRDRRVQRVSKGNWRQGLVAQGLARSTVVTCSDRLRTQGLRLIFDVRSGGSPGVRRSATARTRCGVRRTLRADSSDISAATTGANFFAVTHQLHLLNTTAATQNLPGRSVKASFAFRAGHGSDPGPYSRVAHHAIDSARPAVFVCAAHVAATSPSIRQNRLRHRQREHVPLRWPCPRKFALV
jgi:hypothetical protein